MKQLLLIILLFPFLLPAQNETIDSLKLALKNSKNDTTKCNLLTLLIARTEDGVWELYNDELMKFSSEKAKRTNDFRLKLFFLKKVMESNNNYAYIENNKSEFNKELVFYLANLTIAKTIKNDRYIAECYISIGYNYENQGDLNKAIENYQASLYHAKKSGNEEVIASALSHLGIVLYNQGNIEKANTCYLQSLKIRENIKDSNGIAQTLVNLGTLYTYHGDGEKGLDYFKTALKILQKLNNKRGIGYALNNIAFIYSQNKKNDLAIEYYNKSLEVFKSNNDKKGIVNALFNIGYAFEKNKNYLKALQYYSEGLSLAKEIKDQSQISIALNNIASVQFDNGNIVEALINAKNGLQIANKVGYPDRIFRSASLLKRIYKQQNKFKDAFEMYELESLMRDSISNAEAKKSSLKKQFQYEYEKKATADSVKNVEEKKVKNALLSAQNAQLKQEKTQRFALYGGLLLVIAFLGFVFNRFRLTQKQKGIIEQQKILVDQAFTHLEEKNKEVMDSIHYAKRIQTALLPNEKYIERKLNELN